MENTQIIICIVIFVLSLISYVLNKLPMWVTSMTALLALTITGCIDSTQALSGFADSNTILMGAMFMVAAGLRKTSFIDAMCDSVLKLAKGSFNRAFAAYLLLAILLAQFIPSPVVIFSIVSPLLAELCNKSGVSVSKVMFPLAVVSISTLTIFPLANAITTAGQNNGYLTTYGYDMYAFSPMDFFIGKWPLLIIVPLWAIFFAPKWMPEKPVVPIAGGTQNKGKEKKKLNPLADKMGVVVFFGTVAAMIFSSQLGQPTWVIATTGAVLMVLFGTLTTQEAVAATPLDMILLFVGALGLGTALSATGAGQVIGDSIAVALGGTQNSYLLGAVFFLVPFILTQFMLNRAVSQIFMSIAILTCQALGANPIGVMLLVQAGSLTAFLTPMATPAVPLAMSTGGYDLKALFKGGWSITILLAVVYIAYTMTVYPAF